MKKAFATTVVLSIFTYLLQAPSSLAVQIGASDFGSGASIESFEGLQPGPNLPRYGNYGYLEIGVLSAYSFNSGAILTNPIPNPNHMSGLLIGDFSLGYAYFGLGNNGEILNSSYVPLGSAYMGLNFSGNYGPIEFIFASDMKRVGAYVDGNEKSSITMSGYDQAGNLLETASVPFVSAENLRNNFLGIENSSGIRRVTFSNTGDLAVLVLDGLTFEGPTTPVPEPSTMLLLGSGLIGLAAYGRKRFFKK